MARMTRIFGDAAARLKICRLAENRGKWAENEIDRGGKTGTEGKEGNEGFEERSTNIFLELEGQSGTAQDQDTPREGTTPNFVYENMDASFRELFGVAGLQVLTGKNREKTLCMDTHNLVHGGPEPLYLEVHLS